MSPVAKRLILIGVFIYVVGALVRISPLSARQNTTYLLVVQYDEPNIHHLIIVDAFSDSLNGLSQARAVRNEDEDRFILRLEGEPVE